MHFTQPIVLYSIIYVRSSLRHLPDAGIASSMLWLYGVHCLLPEYMVDQTMCCRCSTTAMCFYIACPLG